jgi:cobaltochelatase CobT
VTHATALALAQFEHVLGSTVVRALTGNSELQWSGRTLYKGVDPVPLVAAHQTDSDTTLDDQRALLDGAALRLRLSNAELHSLHAPQEPVERMVYELLEQLRCESLAPEGLRGVRHNLRERFERWARAFLDSGLTETSLGILLFTISLTVWTRLTGHEIDDSMADLMEATRANIVPELGPSLAELKRQRHNQESFIPHALQISQWVSHAVQSAQSESGSGAASFKSRNGFGLRLHFQTESATPPPVAEIGENKTWRDAGSRYRIFTTAYDEETYAASLIRPAVLAGFRGLMDRDIAEFGFNIPKLARMLQHRLSVVQREGWNFQQEEGYIDGRRLAHLVSSPFERDVFQRERDEQRVDCAVGILFDCSGSMKAHSENTSIIADVLGRALSMAGVATEILGFTTASWNGGRALKDWQRSGRPHGPGRLNEQLHLVFKSATTPWRKARLGVAALRRIELYREGIDGEAVEWACQRLLALSAQRRILLVVSDGCPMDSATHQTNDNHYLDQHLKQTVARYERSGSVQICGLGVGLDLGCFYRRRLAIDLRDGLDEGLLMQIADLIAVPPTRYVAPILRHSSTNRQTQ